LVKFQLIPQDAKFYDLFEQSAANLSTAAEKLVDLFENYVDVRTKVAEIKDLERQGDTITHQIIESLHRTFVTPLDREDITLLAQMLDDMMDFIEGGTKRMLLYRIKEPTSRAIEMSYIINKVAIELYTAMPFLRDHSQLKRILNHCVEIHRLENEADDLRQAALAELFDETEPIDIREILKWQDIYDNLENATDRGEDVANVLEGVVLKHA